MAGRGVDTTDGRILKVGWWRSCPACHVRPLRTPAGRPSVRWAAAPEIGPQVASGQNRPLRFLEARFPGVWRISMRYLCTTIQDHTVAFTASRVAVFS